MASQKVFKQRIRARMAKTGEAYTIARQQLLRKAATAGAKEPEHTAPQPELTSNESEPEPDATGATPTSLEAAEPPTSDAACRRATGRGYDEWFARLDEWGATARRHPEIARWLVSEEGVNGWWSQSITVAYERARGMRARYETTGGFSIAVTRTIEADAATLLAACTDETFRQGWLPGVALRQRPTTAANLARFDWPEPPSRLVVSVTPKAVGRSTIAIQHERLPDAGAAEGEKAAWRSRLTALKVLLEAQ